MHCGHRSVCFAISALLVGLAVGLATSVVAQTRGETGLDVSDRRVDPIQMSSGAVTVLIFVRRDCPVSNRYAPTVQRMSEQFPGNAKFWLVYPEKAATAKTIHKHLDEYHYKLPALRDARHDLARRSGVSVTPEAAVFDVAGKLEYHGRIDNLYPAFGQARSAATTHELVDAIEATLRGEAPKVASTEAVGCYIADME